MGLLDNIPSSPPPAQERVPEIFWKSLADVLPLTQTMRMDASRLPLSNNIEDRRQETGALALLRNFASQGALNGQNNIQDSFQLNMNLLHNLFRGGIFSTTANSPPTTSDPLAAAAGYNSVGR